MRLMLLQLEPDVGCCSDVAPAIALVAVGRISDGAILAQKVDRTTSRDDIRAFETALAEMLQRASEVPAYPGWTGMQQVNSVEQERLLASEDPERDATESGCVYALADSQALCLVAVGFRSQLLCPDRVAQELLEGLNRKVRAVETERRLVKAKPGGLTAKTKRMLREVIRSYSDPDKVNNVRQVYQKFDNFKSLVSDNVKRTLEAHIAMETLQGQGQSISVAAEEFVKESICKRRRGEKQSRRAKIMAGASVCAVLVLLVLPLAIRWS